MSFRMGLEITVAFTQGSLVFPNPWQRAIGRTAEGAQIVCRVEFGVSPIFDRIYVDGLHVEPEYRRKGYATSLLLEIVDSVARSNNSRRLPITALCEVWSSRSFWNALRSGQKPGLEVTRDIRVAEMPDEAKRWQPVPVGRR
jgi:GNAT superfamily N-acetyltransferase